MSANTSANFDALVSAGVIVNTELPDEYARVIDDLTEDEVNAIIDVKRRLDEAGAAAGRKPSETFTNFIVI